MEKTAWVRGCKQDHAHHRNVQVRYDIQHVCEDFVFLLLSGIGKLNSSVINAFLFSNLQRFIKLQSYILKCGTNVFTDIYILKMSVYLANRSVQLEYPLT